VPGFEAILFDLDGTLTDPRIAITSSLAHALREVGFTPPPPDQLIWCIGPPLRQNLLRIMGGERAHLIERAVECYFRRYAIEGVRETILYPGVEEMLLRLRAGGATLYLASAKLTAHASDALAAFSLLGHFAGVYGSARDGSLSDKVELIRFIIAETGIAPERSAMVGDRALDIVAGKANGMFTIGATYGFGSREELEATGADALCASPEALPELLL
jgi:phosphoglycolate phosphatase